jgi:hypothetical protein
MVAQKTPKKILVKVERTQRDALSKITSNMREVYRLLRENKTLAKSVGLEFCPDYELENLGFDMGSWDSSNCY